MRLCLNLRTAIRSISDSLTHECTLLYACACSFSIRVPMVLFASFSRVSDAQRAMKREWFIHALQSFTHFNAPPCIIMCSNRHTLVELIVLKLWFPLLQSMETPIHECARSGNNDILIALLESIPPSKLQATVNKRSSVRSRLKLYTAHTLRRIFIKINMRVFSLVPKAEGLKIETPYSQNKFKLHQTVTA